MEMTDNRGNQLDWLQSGGNVSCFYNTKIKNKNIKAEIAIN